MGGVAESNNRIAAAMLPAVIVLVFGLSFQEALIKLASRLPGGDFDYCYLVPLVFAYLLWDMRYQGEPVAAARTPTDRAPEAAEDKTRIHADGTGFKFGEFGWSVWGLVPIVLSILLMFAGELASVETFVYLGIWGSLFGIGCLLYGRRIRRLAFPFLILLFIIPLPHYINNILTFQLRLLASEVATNMLLLSGLSAYQEGNIIDLDVTKLQVVDACSGLRYLMPLLLLAMLIGRFFCTGWWRKAVLIILVVPLTTLLNAFRIWLTGVLTIYGHGELAQDFFHDLSGWIIFVIAGGILYSAALALRRIGTHGAEPALIDGGAGSIGLLKPALLSIAVCLLFAGSGWALMKIPSASQPPPRSSLERFPMQLGSWNGNRGFISKEVLGSLWADDHVTAAYSAAGVANTIYLLIPYYEYQGTMHTAHAPQACLLGGGWVQLSDKERQVRVAEDRDITIRTMLMKKGDDRMLASYFFFQRGRVITDPWLNKAYLIYDALTKRRTDGALVRVEMTLGRSQTEEQGFQVLAGFIGGLWGVLPQFVPL